MRWGPCWRQGASECGRRAANPRSWRERWPEIEGVEEVGESPKGADSRRYDTVAIAYRVAQQVASSQAWRWADEVWDRWVTARGSIVVADVSFESHEARRACLADAHLDEARAPSWVAEDVIQECVARGWRVKYAQISTCGGIYRLRRGR